MPVIIKGSGGSGSSEPYSIKTLSALPTTGKENDIVVISDVAAPLVVLDTTAPTLDTNFPSGSIFIKKALTSANIINHGKKVVDYDAIVSAQQNINGVLENKAGYVYKNNAWVKFSSGILIYGCKIDKNNSDPLTRVSYTDMAVGMTPCSMNYTTGVFNYGSWEELINQLATPVMLNYNGTVAYELDRTNQTKKADGTASDISNTSFNGNAMVQMKKIYTKVYSDDLYDYFKFSFDKVDDSYYAYAFTNQNAIEQDFAYMPMFRGSSINGKMRSVAGQTPLGNLTGAQEIALASANGTGYYTQYWSMWNLKMQLLFLVGKSTNSQETFGNGNMSSSAPLSTGALKDKGAFYGYNTATQQVKCFYSEVMWADQYDRTMGCVTDASSNIKVKMFPPYNELGTNYLALGLFPASGYLKDATFSEKGILPKNATGSATTYFCDYNNFGASNYVFVGGRYGDGSACGSSFLYLARAFSLADARYGASLFYIKP